VTSVTRSDLEAKLREIEGVVVDVEEEAKSSARMLAIGAAVLVIGIVAISVWRSRRNKIRVEVYKL